MPVETALNVPPVFYEVILPWLFSLAIFYALLNKVPHINDNKRVVGLLSLVLGFAAIRFTPIGYTAGEFLTFLGGFGMVILGIALVVIVFLELTWGKAWSETIAGNKWVTLLLVIVGIIVVFEIFGGAYIYQYVLNCPPGVSCPFGSDMFTVIVLLVVMALVILIMGKESPQPQQGKE